MASKKCQGKKKNGEPCGAWALPGSRFCWSHDPKLKGKRKDARTNGGRSRSLWALLKKLGIDLDIENIKLETLEDVLEQARKLYKVALAMDLTATNLRLALAILEFVASIIRPTENEERLQIVEQRLGIVEVNNKD